MFLLSDGSVACLTGTSAADETASMGSGTFTHGACVRTPDRLVP